MTDKKSNPPADKNLRYYRVASIAFFIGGLLLMISEADRTMGIPFLILGLTFFIISQEESKKKSKKQ